MPKKCKNCGIEFEPKTTLQSCCNIICTQEYTYKRKLLKIPVEKHKVCPECGKEFTLGRVTKSYCSSECSYKTQARNNMARAKSARLKSKIQ